MRTIAEKDLSYLSLQEMWLCLKAVGFPYCTVEDTEKEDLSTGEKVTVPKFIPRTDEKDMRRDILVGISNLNRERRREFIKYFYKVIDARKALRGKSEGENSDE